MRFPSSLFTQCSEGSRIETPCSGQAPWATKELAQTGDQQGATQHMAEPPWSRRFPGGFGMGGMCVHAAGALVQGPGHLQGTVFCELGDDAHFLPVPGCWGRKGGVCHVGWCRAHIPPVTGTGRPCRAAAPLSRNSPRDGKELPSEATGSAEGLIQGPPSRGAYPWSPLSACSTTRGSCLFLLHSQGLEPPQPPCTAPTFGCLHIPAC